ncbi:MAG: metallophosphoesterase family protein [Lachnospiraceae bacterium]|nr:metallophosphoesterase family protein [Lachnospiraceae bacterium]
MKLLCLADEENKGLWDFYHRDRVGDVDLIISCGDLDPSYLEFLVSMTNVPVLYVHGNHDDKYEMKPPLGCTCIDDDIYDHKGLRIMGLGGSMKYGAKKNMYTEREMEKRVKKLRKKAVLMGGIDILVTHAPAAGYGDLEDLPHHGFECFNDLLNEFKPLYMLHGHVHMNYGKVSRETDHPSGTKIINCFDKYELTIPESAFPAQGETGSAMYDLYMRLMNRRKR